MPDLPAVTDADVVTRVGGMTALRGRDYAESGMVLVLEWSSQANALHGLVSGSRPQPYAVTVLFGPKAHPRQSGQILATRCTCPMQVDCKHVAAVLFTSGAEQAGAHDPESAQAWRTALTGLTRLGPPPDPSAHADPIGLQFRVTLPKPRGHRAERMEPGLEMRMVTIGASGRWVQGPPSWNSLAYSTGAHTPAQRSALRAIAALHAADFPYRYGRNDKWLEVHRINAPLLWEALRQARSAGISLVLDDRDQSPVAVMETPIEAMLDISRDASGLSIGVPIRIDDEAADPHALGLIGSPAHGVFAWDALPESTPSKVKATRLRLAPLAAALEAPLADLAGLPPVRVPPADEATFTDEILPGLAASHPIRSLDGSFPIAAPARPRLHATLVHLGTGRLEVSWRWAYSASGSRPPTILPLGSTPGEQLRRDRNAEAEILDRLHWILERFAHLAAPTASGPRLASVGLLVGLDMLDFLALAVPRLEDDPDVDVLIDGDAPEYEELDDDPVISVATTPRTGAHDWLDLEVAVTVGEDDVPLEALLRALTAGAEVLILDSGRYLRLDRPELHRLRDLIEEARALQENVRDPLGISRYHVDLWAELEALGVTDEQSMAWLRTIRSLTDDGPREPRPIPDRLQATLRPYQEEGFIWLAHLRESGLGGVLADDMGLGKTLQAIALIADERGVMKPGRRRRATAPPWLVVAPASVVHNWAVEFARFAPSITVATITETTARRGVGIVDTVGRDDVIVMSYALFRIDIEELVDLPWAGVIFDEAQFVKNHGSKVYSCARRVPAPVKFAITGTPMENNLMELWSILSITAPGLFPSPKRFSEFFAKPIEREGDDDRLALLRRRMRPFLMRRTKEQVASELPSKQEQILELDLHPRHRRIYDTRLQRERQKVLGLLDDLEANRFQVFQTLTMLRQLSLDVTLIDETQSGIPSSKLDALMEMLADVTAEGHRVLVFSQFTRYLALARQRLDDAGIDYAYLDGRTRNRARAIDSFRDGNAPVFLISLKAGGFGLNLTEADYVVLLDPWWNPATEAQAVDRAHRIGQDRQVMVYRLVSRDTIEEKVMALKAEKAALFAGVMSEAGAGSSTLSADDIRALLQ